VVFCVAASDFIFHMLIAGNYGYFRDELYYIVAGQHLSFGYVDFPPLIALLAAFMYVIAKDSLVSIHLIPAIAGAAIVFLSGRIAAQFGGGTRAQVLAAVATMFSASFAVSSIFSMDVLDMLWWTLLTYLLVMIIKKNNRDPKLWILFGLVAGIGLMTKLTIAFFLVSLLIGLALTSKRSYLRSKWVWIGAAISLAFVSPYVLWNYVNGWPTIDFFIHHGGLNGGGSASFLENQVLIAGLVGIPLAIMGLVFLFRSSVGRSFTALGIAFVILLTVFTLTNGKPYFIMGAYPYLFAGGATLLVGSATRRRRALWTGYLSAIIVVGVMIAPLYAPVLSPQTFVKYYGGLTGAANGAAAQQDAGAFPQYLGDRFGWDTMTASVAQVYNNLNASEKAQVCILTENYGEGSALTFLGKPYGLPHVISGHNNFYLWGPGSCTGQVLIIVGYSLNDVQSHFDNVTIGGTIICSYCMTSEDNLPILVATGPISSLQSSWILLKHYN
jgi:hypothetical protein